MSSLRNSLHRRNHKERSQLSGRAKLGILEKHKDYVLRARDYHSKQDRLNLLRQKATERNKDEFYFSMARQRTERGVHVQDRGNQTLPTDVVKVLKTQDESYLRAMRTAGLKKIEKLKEQLSVLANLVKPSVSQDGDTLDEQEVDVLVEAGVIAAPSAVKRRKRRSASAKGKHFVFAETPQEAQEAARHGQDSLVEAGTSHDAESAFDLGWEEPSGTEGGRKRRGKLPRKEDVDVDMDEGEDDDVPSNPSDRPRLLKELSARLVRDKQLRYAMRELEMQRLLMAKGAARKLSGVEEVKDEEDDDDDDDDEPRPKKKVDEKTWKPRMYRWRLERKK